MTPSTVPFFAAQNAILVDVFQCFTSSNPGGFDGFVSKNLLNALSYILVTYNKVWYLWRKATGICI